MRKQFRQGDVLLLQVDFLPPDATPADPENGRIVLAEGEATGHAHAVSASGAVLLRTPGGQRYLRLERGSEIVHEEHRSISLPAGQYEVIRQREFSPDDPGWRRYVMD